MGDKKRCCKGAVYALSCNIVRYVSVLRRMCMKDCAKDVVSLVLSQLATIPPSTPDSKLLQIIPKQ